MSKEFDAISHVVLKKILKMYGIKRVALDLISSYLSNRSQFCYINDTLSKSMPVHTYGIPQGSILGPLLFNIYVKEFKLTHKHSSNIQFADDSALYNAGNNIKLLLNQVNKDVEELSEWCRAKQTFFKYYKIKLHDFRSKMS